VTVGTCVSNISWVEGRVAVVTCAGEAMTAREEKPGQVGMEAERVAEAMP
jgi:hypothetical protein